MNKNRFRPLANTIAKFTVILLKGKFNRFSIAIHGNTIFVIAKDGIIHITHNRVIKFDIQLRSKLSLFSNGHLALSDN